MEKYKAFREKEVPEKCGENNRLRNGNTQADALRITLKYNI